MKAKRRAPTIPDPVFIGSVRYSAEHEGSGEKNRGIIVATQVASGNELWRVTVYESALDPKLERDVQWVFIRSLRAEGDRKLHVENERGARFILDVKILTVTPEAR